MLLYKHRFKSRTTCFNNSSNNCNSRISNKTKCNKTKCNKTKTVTATKSNAVAWTMEAI